MKKCDACGEEFQNQFNFCPVDGASLVLSAVSSALAYRPTIIADALLVRRLTIQVSFLIEELRTAWPKFLADPDAFLKSQIQGSIQLIRRALAQPNLQKG